MTNQRPSAHSGVSLSEARQRANNLNGRSRRGAALAATYPNRVFVDPAPLGRRPPRKVRRCRAARHAICAELNAALDGELLPMLGQPDGTSFIEAAITKTTNPVENAKRCWLHAAALAAGAGFRFEATPFSDDRTPCAYILCGHGACRAHTGNVVALTVSDSIDLKGLSLAGLVPEMDAVERCMHRRRSVLGARMRALCGDHGFVIPDGIDMPYELSIRVARDGAGVAVVCAHQECVTVDKHEMWISWDPVTCRR